MPELPEVETVVRGLRRSLPGRVLGDVRFGKTDFVKDPGGIAEELPGRRVVDITRAGKFIFISLEKMSLENARRAETAEPQASGCIYLVIHLGMTGQLRVCRSGDAVLPHTHCFIGLDDGYELRYTDPRRFGRMLLVEDFGLERFKSPMGREPLEIGADEFCRIVGSRRAMLKALLLNQSVLRGIGNIYADESLFRAKLHPARIASEVPRRQLLALHTAIRHVLEAAIRYKGSSISDYVDSEGNKGGYQSQHRVYQREGEPCLKCGSKIRRAVIAGRSSHFCPSCQRPPRAKRAFGQERKVRGPQPAATRTLAAGSRSGIAAAKTVSPQRSRSRGSSHKTRS